ncbi:MAG: hypothetical protein M3Z08_08065 [Chloroflexota bacterium]|nr:hypothetical protein [Chloroflexota bacterium]
MIPETHPSDVPYEGSSISDDLRTNLESLVLKLIIVAYKKMYAAGRYDTGWKENKFNAVLKGYTKKECRQYSRLTGQLWYVDREYYKDDDEVLFGEGDPDAVPRIDIVIITWVQDEDVIFPFECKLLSEKSKPSLKKYIERGLIDRYLNQEKDYSLGSNWGGMIGYVLHGKHETIATKLNEQVTAQLNCTTAHLEMHQPIDGFDAIYKSQHQRPNKANLLTITHLLLTFFTQV